jgi:hypothetical protein
MNISNLKRFFINYENETQKHIFKKLFKMSGDLNYQIRQLYKISVDLRFLEKISFRPNE